MPSAPAPAVEFVPARRDTAAESIPPALRGRVQVATLHDGDVVPPELLRVPEVAAMDADGRLRNVVADVRDWGADRVAHHVAAGLGVGGHTRVRVARAVVDFNRFPGMTRPGSEHVDRLALGGPIADALDEETRRAVLADYYDAISASIESIIRGQLILLSIHTYDEHNPTETQRPEVSVLTRSDSYQQNSRLPFGLFDPLFPDVLAESSAKRVLRDRLALTLEKAGVNVEHNYPYCLPDGSLEIRSQPWFFFHRLRQTFEAAHPETAGDARFDRVWEMLFNTNLRQADSSALSRYLHRYCAAPAGEEAAFESAAAAYAQIRSFLGSKPDFVPAYRRSTRRTSTITIEVRKDLVWRFDGGVPTGPNEENAARIGSLVAEGIATFLREDLPAEISTG